MTDTDSECILALGAEMQGCYSISRNKKIFTSDVFGDTSDYTVFSKYKAALLGYISSNSIKPAVILCDLHPGYNTSILAKELSSQFGCKLAQVQHHKAHAYAVAEEHELKDFAAIACDGLGFGEDGTIWGGEVFVNDRRIGHLELHSQLGGDLAAKEPARMLYSILSKVMDEEELNPIMVRFFSKEELAILKKQLYIGYNSPLTSSAGRVLDAASVLLGFSRQREYDGSPAIELDKNATVPYLLKPAIKENTLLTSTVFRYLADNMGKDRKRLAATVLYYVADGLYEIAAKERLPVLFTGGCAHSRTMKKALEGKVLLNKAVPCGDAGISRGQIAYYLAKVH
ncbi:MAG: hypothetical protein HGA85_00600 [Nanoarchaeota archaeon]|nr:hypothetical protein [Nanoarchaeota archaeon]